VFDLVFSNLDKEQANNLWKEQLTKPKKDQSGENDD
jgi:Lon-like ATP-dependent protease